MFVTSDTFDLKRIGRRRDFEWRENLLCGVAVHGAQWLGYQAGAKFLLEAAKLCGLMDEMKWAGYDKPLEKRTRPIAPKSFERLARGELAGAKDASGVLLTGEREARGTERGDIVFGGEADASLTRRSLNGAVPRTDGPPWRFSADFLFPIDDRPVERAIELFQLSVDLLGAEYGYYFVRDEMGLPSAYAHGIGTGLDYSPLAREESVEIRDWAHFADEELWTGKWPLLRDLFEVNLLSQRHTSAPIEGLGYLTEWISAQPGRGRLQDMGKGRLLWILTDAEIFNVRPLLNEAGLLLSCRDRVYRDLPGGSVNSATSPADSPPVA
jgi:hypothetical protein